MPQFLVRTWKRAGAATITVLLLTGLTWAVGSFARAAEQQLDFTFLAVNDAPATDGVEPTLVMWGNGTFTADSVNASGRYKSFDNATEVPKTLLSTGTWEATDVIRWVPAEGEATWGRTHPGVVDLRVTLIPDEGPMIEGATLRVNCNVGAAGITINDPDTGEPLTEGYWLTLPEEATFGPITGVGTFAPKDPILGMTVIGR